jgi:hypothetical protein
VSGRVRALFLFSLLGPQSLQAQAPPKLVSVFPLGGPRGTALEVEVRGAGLEGSYAVWLGPGSKLESLKSPSASQANIQHTKGPDGVEAHVKAVQDGSRVKVRLVMAPDARVGFHSLSLISPGGVSGAIPFWVGPDAVIQETAAPHKTPETAQPVKLPIAINGRISETGQLAYYAFEITQKQTVAFEVIALQGPNFDPQLALYEAGGSYLDPRRSKRLVFHEEVTQGGMPASRRMTFHFTKPGRYLVTLGNPFAQGVGDFSYLLRIAPAPLTLPSPPGGEGQKRGAEDALAWGRRRLHWLHSRTVGAPTAEVRLVKETEPNDQPEQAKVFEVSAVLEGTIGQPGDIDRFRFKAKAGQKLAIEVQTPRASAPHFNLRLDVLDARKTVVLSNLSVQDGKIGTEDAKVIQVAPEVRGTLDREGEYTLRIRDLTSIHGSPDHVYRVLVRPQVPHLGDFQQQPPGPVNLRPGVRQRLTLSAPGKEGYAGTFALSVEGLPQGIKAFVGPNSSTIELVAEASAPGTPLPQVLRISGLPHVGGKSGSPFPVGEIPVMVVKK